MTELHCKDFFIGCVSDYSDERARETTIAWDRVDELLRDPTVPDGIANDLILDLVTVCGLLFIFADSEATHCDTGCDIFRTNVIKLFLAAYELGCRRAQGNDNQGENLRPFLDALDQGECKNE